MAAPLDGYGIYESIRPTDATIGARLSTIAGLGMSLVLNYALLFGHITDLTSYINIAHTNGLKVIVALNDAVIWDGTTNINTKYPNLISDWGGSGTDYAGFSTWLVGQLKGLSGVWGWYVGDEVTNANHGLLLAHANVIKAADSTHPRLFIASGTSTATSFGAGNSIFGDCAEVVGDDFYPMGSTANLTGMPSFPSECAGIQTYASQCGLQSAVVLQAWSYQQIAQNNVGGLYPGGAPYPYREQMRALRDAAMNNMTPRMVLWYYFPYIYDSAFTVDGTRQQADLAWASNGIGTADNVLARDTFLRTTTFSPSSTGEIWNNLNAQGTSMSVYSGKISGVAETSMFLLGSGTCWQPSILYRWFTARPSDIAGVILRYVDSNNYTLVEIQNNSIQIVDRVNGTNTLSPVTATVAIVAETAYWTRVTASNGNYTVKIWTDGTVEPGSAQFSWTNGAYLNHTGQYGLLAILGNNTTAAIYVNSFEVYSTSVNTTYSVATTGNDSNAGTSGSPFASFQQALNVVNPGDTLSIGAGVLIPPTPIYSASGSTTAPITITTLAPFVGNLPPTNNNYIILPAHATFPPAVRRSGVFPTAKRRQS